MDIHLQVIICFVLSMFKGCAARCYYSRIYHNNYCYYYTMSGSSVAGLAIGSIIGVGLLIALIVMCCVRGSRSAPGVIYAQPQGMTTVAHLQHPAHVNPGFSPGYSYGQPPPPYSGLQGYPIPYTPPAASGQAPVSPQPGVDHAKN